MSSPGWDMPSLRTHAAIERALPARDRLLSRRPARSGQTGSGPQRGRGVRGEGAVVRHDRQAFLDRLSDEEAVEGIAMMGRKPAYPKRVRDRHRQLIEACRADRV